MFFCIRSPKLLFTILAVVTGIIGLGFYFQWTFVMEYWWLLLIVFLCPLMHILGGHNHGSNDNHNDADHPHKNHKNSGKSCH